MMNYTIIRSNRKTFSLQIKNGALIVRVPQRATDRAVAQFVEEHEAWIEKHHSIDAQKQKEADAIVPLSEEELKALTAEAKRIIPRRVEFYAAQLGVSYGKISIRHQKTRWGCCSSEGNLTFNCLLLLTPPEILDYIVVHELCHSKEMNHGKAFYNEVLRVFPEYHKWNRWLKENGDKLMRRMIG